MPFITMPSDAFTEAYMALARKHNDPATPKYERDILQWKAHGMLDAVRADHGSSATGLFICNADAAVLETLGDVPTCGGFILHSIADIAAA